MIIAVQLGIIVLMIKKNTAAEVKSTAEEVTQSQSVQNVNSGYMLSGKGNDKSVANEKNGWVFGSTLGYGSSYGKPNDGYPDYSFASRWTEIHDLNKQIPRDMRGASSNSSSYVFPQNLGLQRLGLSTTQDSAGSGTYDGDVRHSSEAYVTQNTTGDGFMADIAEREAFGKMPLPSYLGYGVKDNIKLIEGAPKKYKDEIEIAVEIAKSIVPNIVLEIAEKAVVFLPLPLQGGARGILIAIDIGLAVYEVYDQWDTEVRAYEQKHECSREVAEENVEIAKKVNDAFMIFSTNEWLKYVMRSAGHPADFRITVGLDALEMISEEKFREWVRMITK